MPDTQNPRKHKLMPCVLFFTVLLGVLQANAADTPAAAPAHLIVGTWNWTLFNGQCSETLQYRPDGVVLSTSGEAVTEWRYSIDKAPGKQGFYKVQHVSTRHNGKKDCSGDAVEEAGLESTHYIQLSPAKDRLIVCKSESLAACYGPLQRQP